MNVRGNIYYAFFGLCLSKIDIPSSVMKVGNSAFFEGSSATKDILDLINSKANTISDSAFRGYSLLAFEPPGSVKWIRKAISQDC
jgi:hypothetical protein